MYRRLISQVLQSTGALGIWRRMRAHEISVLTLHSVLDDRKTLPWTPMRSFMRAEQLDANIALLKRHHTFISITEAHDILTGKKPPVRNGVVVTLDDGYQNNFSVALPIFDKHQVPATFFVVTDKIRDQAPYWFDRFDYAMQKNLSAGDTFSIGDERITVTEGGRPELKRLMLKCFRILKNRYSDDYELKQHVHGVIEEIQGLKGQALADVFNGQDPAAIVGEQALKAASENPLVTIGSHTASHIRLKHLDKDRSVQELEASARAIREMTGNSCRFFCYPNGEYSTLAEEAVKSTGYSLALTCDDGTNNSGDDLFRLKRINWPTRSHDSELLSLVSGAYRDWFSNRERVQRTLET